MVSNFYINDVLKNISSFCGTFSCDNIISGDSSDKLNSYIINLSSKNEPGTHFIALSINHEDKKIFYFDSFGRKCKNKEILRFISKYDYQYRYCNRQIQDPLSVYCGFFCICFVVSTHLSIPFTRIVKIYDVHNFKKNDEICINMIKTLARRIK